MNTSINNIETFTKTETEGNLTTYVIEYVAAGTSQVVAVSEATYISTPKNSDLLVKQYDAILKEDGSRVEFESHSEMKKALFAA